MTEDMVFGLLYIAGFCGGFVLLLVLTEGLFSLAYRFIPALRRQMDRFFDSLPQWEEEEVSE